MTADFEEVMRGLKAMTDQILDHAEHWTFLHVAARTMHYPRWQRFMNEGERDAVAAIGSGEL